jgi:hypothetical protein
MQHQGSKPNAASNDKQDACEHPGITHEVRYRIGIGVCQSFCNRLSDREIPSP